MMVKKVTGAAGEEKFFILPPRASRELNLSHTTSASLPGTKLLHYQIMQRTLRNFSLEKLEGKSHLFFLFILNDLWFLRVKFDGTSAGQQQEQEEQQEQQKKVWRPPATAESSRTASLARTTRARRRNRNRFPGWGP